MSTRKERVHSGVIELKLARSSRPSLRLTAPTIQIHNQRPVVRAQTFPSRLPKGAILNGRYVVDRYLASGGFADVYAGEDRDTRDQVALKILKCLGGGVDIQRNAEERFFQDARLASRMQHPNVARTLAFSAHMFLTDPQGQSSSFRRPFIVLELLQGDTLAHTIQAEGALHPTRVAHLLLGALDGLAVGHRLGVVHKDLKPDNLFVTHPTQPNEHLKVLDFGTARIVGENWRSLTQPGGMCFTPRYAAPEYLKDGSASPAIDVYQMGLVMIEMLTGKPAIDASDLMTCTQAHWDGINIPPKLGRSTFGPLLRRALARRPEDRYPDASSFRDALRRRCATIFKK